MDRNSLLFVEKGRRGGTGAYRGAHWHTVGEIRALFARLPVADLTIRTAILLPQGGFAARAAECCWPRTAHLGGFIAVAGRTWNGGPGHCGKH